MKKILYFTMLMFLSISLGGGALAQQDPPVLTPSRICNVTYLPKGNDYQGGKICKDINENLVCEYKLCPKGTHPNFAYVLNGEMFCDELFRDFGKFVPQLCISNSTTLPEGEEDQCSYGAGLPPALLASLQKIIADRTISPKDRLEKLSINVYIRFVKRCNLSILACQDALVPLCNGFPPAILRQCVLSMEALCAAGRAV